jgi:hypothetical protein
LNPGIVFVMERESRWFYSVWSVLLALFVVLGPFGLPLLWRSPRFSRGMKVLLTAATVVYTALLIGETLRAGRLVGEMLESLGQM